MSKHRSWYEDSMVRIVNCLSLFVAVKGRIFANKLTVTTNTDTHHIHFNIVPISNNYDGCSWTGLVPMGSTCFIHIVRSSFAWPRRDHSQLIFPLFSARLAMIRALPSLPFVAWFPDRTATAFPNPHRLILLSHCAILPFIASMILPTPLYLQTNLVSLIMTFWVVMVRLLSLTHGS